MKNMWASVLQAVNYVQSGLLFVNIAKLFMINKLLLHAILVLQRPLM